MGTVYTKAKYLEHLNLIKPLGFTLNSDEIYEKSINNGKVYMYIAADEHFPHSAIFGQVVIRIRFTNVENIFSQACTSTNNTVYQSEADDPTFGKGFAKSVIGQENFDSLYENEVNDDQSFNLVRPLLEQMINAALQWANQNDNLQNAYNNAEMLSVEARRKLYSQPFPAKYMIVKKLLGASDYSTYAADVVSFYNSEPDANKANFYQTLKTLLDAL
jgi:hypothetical protein